MIRSKLWALLAALVLIVTACGRTSANTTAATPTETTASAGETTPAETTQSTEQELSELGLPLVDPLAVDPSVDIAIAGSSTVFPLSTEVLSQWIDEGGPEYAIDSIGSGGGLERFCVEGASDIANASRPIDQDEVDACASIGRSVIEIRVGSDALSLVISQGNYFAQELTLEEIATAFSLTSPDATWADVNPEFPAHPIQVFSPGADSGTFDYFNEIVFPEEYDAEEPSPILSSIAEIVGEDDNLTVRGVGDDGCTEGETSTTCAIGYFGYAFYINNSDVLKAVTVEGIEPSEETVNANTYPIARPLFMYTAHEVIAEKPEVAEFIAYYLNTVNSVIGEVGYFPAPEDALLEAADNIATAAGWR